ITILPLSPDGTTHGLVLATVSKMGTICTPGATAPFVPPVGQQQMAAAVPLPDLRLRLQSDALAAFAASAIRHGGADALMFRATSELGLRASTTGIFDPFAPRLMLYVYRTTAPALVSRR